MPRPKKPASTEDLPDGISFTPAGTYRARWRDDQRKQQSKNFERLEDAERHLRSVLTDLDRGVYTSPSAGRLTVAKFADEWLASATNLAPGGRETYRRDLDEYILPEIGGLQLTNLSARVISRFLTDELEAGKAPSSVVRYYRTIHRLCEIAIQHGRLKANPCATVATPHAPPAEMRFLGIDQVLALADAIGPQGHPMRGGKYAESDAIAAVKYRAWLLVAAFGGLRWSETVGLRRSHIEGARIQVVEKLIRREGEWCREPPKSAAGRRGITLPQTAARALALHLRNVPADPDALVFPNSQGDPMINSNFRSRVFQPALERAGISSEFRIHDLRHTAVALAIRAGAHPKAIQVRMGHASIVVTLDRYGHLFPEMDGEIAAGIEGLLKTKPVRPHAKRKAARSQGRTSRRVQPTRGRRRAA